MIGIILAFSGFVGIVGAILGNSSAGEDVFSLLLGSIFTLIIALPFVLDAFEINLVISTTSGKEKAIDFFIFDSKKCKLAEEGINDLISGRLDDTNVRHQTDRILDALGSNSEHPYIEY